MRHVIEKSYFDWSREKNSRIQSRGIAAILSQRAKIIENTKSAGTTRCVWPSAVKGDSRYLSRRVWMS